MAAAPLEPQVLLIGFEPFGGEARNASAWAVQALAGERIAGHAVVAAVLPTAFGRGLAVLEALLDAHRPALVLACGQAGGRAALSLERVAVNLRDAPLPDNDGRQPVDEPVLPGGPAAYFSSLPVKAMRAALEAAGLPAEVSHSAGTFVCNDVFYGLMHRLAQPGCQGVRGGFLHLPWLPGQGQPALEPGDLARGLRIALACALQTPADIRLASGSIS